MLFCHARLPRAGLANRLFTWARCKLYSLNEGVPMIAPFHTQLKVGPMLRGERDWRLYRGQLRPAPGEITGLRRLWLLATSARVLEDAARGGLPQATRSHIVEFSARHDSFVPLLGQGPAVRAELGKMVHPRWLAAAAKATVAPIGIHVRLGDFETPSSEADFFSRGFLRTPLSWFLDTLAFIRQQAGSAVPAFVVSDGEAADLRALLTIPAVHLLRTGSAIGDLLALSRSRFLLASGGSSFSAWGAYLGEIPAVSRPGQSLAWFDLSHANGAFVGEFSSEQAPSPLLLASIRAFL